MGKEPKEPQRDKDIHDEVVSTSREDYPDDFQLSRCWTNPRDETFSSKDPFSSEHNAAPEDGVLMIHQQPRLDPVTLKMLAELAKDSSKTPDSFLREMIKENYER